MGNQKKVSLKSSWNRNSMLFHSNICVTFAAKFGRPPGTKLL